MSTIEQLVMALGTSSSDDQLLMVARAYASERVREPAAIASLAERVARSGTVLKPRGNPSGDVASTGGPTSLSTLLGPLFLASAGIEVPKLGIPGRPAGGIDSLAQIPGYRTRLSAAEITGALDACGYAHFLPTESLAPLDKRLFALRQKNGLQDVVPLVIASLLAKKLAVGLHRFAIDVRVFPSGNFGATWEEASANARLFGESASHLGLYAATLLTDGRFPQQPFIGRKEALWALSEIFEMRAAGDLELHAMRCRSIAQACAPEGRSMPADGNSLRQTFAANLVAQGAAPESFDALVETTAAGHTRVIRAAIAGYFTVDLPKLRAIVVRSQSSQQGDIDFPDPLGIRLLKRPGEWIAAGEPAATVRASDNIWPVVEEALGDCIGKPSQKPIAAGVEGVS